MIRKEENGHIKCKLQLLHDNDVTNYGKYGLLIDRSSCWVNWRFTCTYFSVQLYSSL